MSVRVTLITRCGCTQEMVIPARTPYIRIPMMRRWKWDNDPSTDTPVSDVRQFELEMWHPETLNIQETAVYREVEL